MSLDEFLNLTDDEIKFLVSYDYGTVLNNPRHGSVLDELSNDDLDEEDDPDDSENLEPTLEEKISDLDSPNDVD